jgi:DNA invertase Pin-like site-specific DNA recombinase
LDLQEVLNEARRLRAVIVVTDITRLGRSDTLADLIRQLELEVFSADTGRILTYEELKRRLSNAQAYGEALQRRVKNGIAIAKSKGRRPGNSKNLRHAQQRAAIERENRANERTEQIAHILSQVDPKAELSAAKVASLLNNRGLRTARGNAWTKDRVRRHLRKARVPEVDWIEDDSDDWSTANSSLVS